MSVFLEIDSDSIILEGKYLFAVFDKFPVSPGHTLIISKQVKETYFDLTYQEKHELLEMIDQLRSNLDNQYSPEGYNIGMNCGVTAGQTVMHFHCHLIPRYKGDMEDPRGGVRHCIKGKGNYLS